MLDPEGIKILAGMVVVVFALQAVTICYLVGRRR